MKARERSEFARDVKLVRSQFGAGLCARLLGVDVAVVRGWANGKFADEDRRRRVEDLKYIGDLFAQYGSPEIAPRWMNAMNPALSYETPADEIGRGLWVRTIAAARDYVATA